jgi:hypothetical protein
MSRMYRRLALLLAFALFQGAALAATLPDYIRYTEDGSSSRLEVAIKSFALPSGQKVDLIGAVHIADASYYQELNRRFTTYDSVLFELVGDPEALTASAPDPDLQGGESIVSYLQQAAGEYLHLTFQLGAIDYSRKNMVHADTSAEEFEEMQQERGESMATLFMRAMQAHMNEQPAAGAAAGDELDALGLVRVLMAPDSAAEFKKALAKNFGQMEALTASLEGTTGTAILSGRNEVALKKLQEVLVSRSQRHVAVFYGAAHMPGIEAALIRGLKAKPAGETWLSAWTMPR